MKIVVVGAGYVGLTTSAGLAKLGHTVVCLDSDHAKVKALQEGQVPFYEPGLPELVKEGWDSLRLSFDVTGEGGYGVHLTHADAVFIAVGTPSRLDGGADLGQIFQVAQEIGKAALHGKPADPLLVLIKSTVPVGTAEKVRAILEQQLANNEHWQNLRRCLVISNPEFLREGQALQDFFRPDRIIFGMAQPEYDEMREVLSEIYKPVPPAMSPTVPATIFTTNESAELIKYASNAMLAVRISFANELARLCERTGADVEDVTKGMGLDRRIGPAFLKAGMGYGGSCFGKDTLALLAMGKEHHAEMLITQAAARMNVDARSSLFVKAWKHFGGATGIKGKRFALWGMAFKPETDDVRDAPALDLADSLEEVDAIVYGYDPKARDNVVKELNRRHPERPCYKADLEAIPVEERKWDTVKLSPDALFVCTEWDEFKKVTPQELAAHGVNVVFDGRNIWNPREMLLAGITYYSVGRAAVLPRES